MHKYPVLHFVNERYKGKMIQYLCDKLYKNTLSLIYKTYILIFT